jgi:hypothetical protein
MSYSFAQPAQLAPAPRNHVRDSVLAVVMFFAALGFAAAVAAPRGVGTAAEPGCAGACWERVV